MFYAVTRTLQMRRLADAARPGQARRVPLLGERGSPARCDPRAAEGTDGMPRV